MNLSISNIAWSGDQDTEMLSYIKKEGLQGIEIAPTRIIPRQPYNNIEAAKRYSAMLKNDYNICISSMQAIWFGINESIFGTVKDRVFLIDHTKKAVDFAEAIDCKNLVFGSPRNRIIPDEESLPIAVEFFRGIGSYAKEHKTTISIEPNAVIYGTNFINTTEEAFEICRQIDNAGIRVNVDLGTMIYNNETLDIVKENIDLVNHIHISEPFLEKIQVRDLHRELRGLDFGKFYSIEMKNLNSIEIVKGVIRYVKGVLA